MKHCVECGRGFDGDGWECPACGFAPERAGDWPSFSKGYLGGGGQPFDGAMYAGMMAYERRSFYSRARRRLIVWGLRECFPGACTLLDLGVGTGAVLAAIRDALPAVRLFGADTSIDSLAITRDRLGKDACLIHTDAGRIPFADHFDVVGAFDVVEHIDDDGAALRAIHGAVKPGGGVLLTVPQHRVFWSGRDEEVGHKRRYVGRELAAKVEAAGFEVVLDTSFMATLFVPQYLARRVLVWRGRRSYKADHDLPRPLDRALGAMLDAELALIRAGVRFPFGGLRIVGGRKRRA